MITTLLDIIPVTNFEPVQALLLLLLLDTSHGGNLTRINKEFEMKIKEHMIGISGIKNQKEAEEMLLFILDDKFSKETLSAARNREYVKQLNQLKNDTINFYLDSINNNSITNPDLKYNCDIHTTVGEKVFQIMRFRMVIQPEIQITVNVHKQTKIVYLTVKGFWLNDDGVKGRKFSKSIGRADEYTLGKDDPKAIEDGTIKMQEILHNEYLNCYSVD